MIHNFTGTEIEYMEEKILKGTISFVNYEKKFATIEYLQGVKKKSVNCKTETEEGGRKPHHFRIGDTVSFRLKLSDRGDKMTAFQVKFLHNTALSLLLQKATFENRFAGYLKKTDGKYFVKECDSYIFFPLKLSPWEKPPVETAENEAISFRLLHLEKPNALEAELFSHNYIPEYRKAVQHFKNDITIDAVVNKVSPHAVYLNLFDDKITGKLPVTAKELTEIKVGDVIQVAITHLTHTRIVIKRVNGSGE
jgi:translation initiation factor IF-1